MEGKNILIIGKRSNLSNQLQKYLEDPFLIQTNDLKEFEEFLKVKRKIVIIYNSCVPGNKLNLIEDPTFYINYSISFLSKFIYRCINFIDNIEQIIFTSSGAIYGDNKDANETDPYKIVNLYSSLKISSELLLMRYLGNSPIKITIARVFNMYGGNDNFSVLQSIVKCLKSNQAFNLNNNGNSIRDFIHINDICKIYKKIIYSDFEGYLNICTGNGMKISDLKELSEKTFQKKLKIINSSTKEISVSIGSTRKLNEFFGKIKYHLIEDYLKFENELNK